MEQSTQRELIARVCNGTIDNDCITLEYDDFTVQYTRYGHHVNISHHPPMQVRRAVISHDVSLVGEHDSYLDVTVDAEEPAAIIDEVVALIHDVELIASADVQRVEFINTKWASEDDVPWFIPSPLLPDNLLYRGGSDEA